MNDPTQSIIKVISNITATLLTIWIFVFLVQFGIRKLKAAFLPKVKGMAGELIVGNSFNEIFSDVLHDIVIPDGRGGLTQVDHIALSREGIVVIETKNYEGQIFGKEHDDRWTQKLGRHTYQFQNPIRQNYLHIRAIQSLNPGVPVHGHVVFTNKSKFPKGTPNGVSQLRDLRSKLSRFISNSPIPAPYIAAWQNIKKAAKSDQVTRRKHIQELNQRNSLNNEQRSFSFNPFRSIKTPLFVIAIAVLAIILLQPNKEPTTNTRQTTYSYEDNKIDTPQVQNRDTKSAIREIKRNQQKPMELKAAHSKQSTSPIQWSSNTSEKSEDCNIAIAAVLIDNTPENVKARDKACNDQTN